MIGYTVNPRMESLGKEANMSNLPPTTVIERNHENCCWLLIDRQYSSAAA